jgi:hypothetical protein
MRNIVAGLLFCTFLVPCIVEAGSRTGTIPVKATINPGTTTLSWTVRHDTPIAVSASAFQAVPHSLIASVFFPTDGARTVTPHASWDPSSRTLILNF